MIFIFHTTSNCIPTPAHIPYWEHKSQLLYSRPWDETKYVFAFLLLNTAYQLLDFQYLQLTRPFWQVGGLRETIDHLFLLSTLHKPFLFPDLTTSTTQSIQQPLLKSCCIHSKANIF